MDNIASSKFIRIVMLSSGKGLRPDKCPINQQSAQTARHPGLVHQPSRQPITIKALLLEVNILIVSHLTLRSC